MAYYLKNKKGQLVELSVDDIFSIASTGKAKREVNGKNVDREFIKPEKGVSFRQKLLDGRLFVTPDEIPGGTIGIENLPSEYREDIKSKIIPADNEWLKGFYARNLSNKGVNEDFGDGHIIPTITEIAEEMGRKGAKVISTNPFKKDLKKAKREYDQTGDEGAKKRYEEFKRMSDEWETYLNSTNAPEWSDSRLGQARKLLEETVGDNLDAFDLLTAGIPLGTTIAGLTKAGAGLAKVGPKGAAKVGEKMMGAASKMNEGWNKLGDLKYNPLSGRATQDVLTQTGLEGIHGALQTDRSRGEGYLSNALEQGLIAGGLTGLLHLGFGDIGNIANTPENRKIRANMDEMRNPPSNKKDRTVRGIRGEGMDFRPIEMRGKPVLTPEQAEALKRAEYDKMRLEPDLDAEGKAIDVRIPKEKFDELVEDVNTAMYSAYANEPGYPRSATSIFEATDGSVRNPGIIDPKWKTTVEQRLPYPTEEGYSLKDIIALPEHPVDMKTRAPGQPQSANLGDAADAYLVHLTNSSVFPSAKGDGWKTWEWPKAHMDAAAANKKYYPAEYNAGLVNLANIDKLAGMKYSPSLPERHLPGKLFPSLGDISERRLVGEFGVGPWRENIGLDVLRELVEGYVDKKTEGL